MVCHCESQKTVDCCSASTALESPEGAKPAPGRSPASAWRSPFSAIAALRRQGLGWRAIAQQLGVGVGTLYRVTPGCSKIQQKVFGTR